MSPFVFISFMSYSGKTIIYSSINFNVFHIFLSPYNFIEFIIMSISFYQVAFTFFYVKPETLPSYSEKQERMVSFKPQYYSKFQHSNLNHDMKVDKLFSNTQEIHFQGCHLSPTWHPSPPGGGVQPQHPTLNFGGDLHVSEVSATHLHVEKSASLRVLLYVFLSNDLYTLILFLLFSQLIPSFFLFNLVVCLCIL